MNCATISSARLRLLARRHRMDLELAQHFFPNCGIAVHVVGTAALERQIRRELGVVVAIDAVAIEHRPLLLQHGFGRRLHQEIGRRRPRQRLRLRLRYRPSFCTIYRLPALFARLRVAARETRATARLPRPAAPAVRNRPARRPVGGGGRGALLRYDLQRGLAGRVLQVHVGPTFDERPHDRRACLPKPRGAAPSRRRASSRSDRRRPRAAAPLHRRDYGC